MKIDYNKWCNRCLHHTFDLTKGIVCGLTEEKPKFIETCNVFKLDENRIKYIEFKENERIKRENKRIETSNTIFFDFLSEKKLLLPFFLLLSFISIYYFDSSEAKSLIIAPFVILYTIVLLFSTRYISKSERYIYVENNRVKNIAGPGIITLLSISKYKKININIIAPDLINNKYFCLYLKTKR